MANRHDGYGDDRSWNAIVTHRCMLLTRLPLYIIRLTMPNQETLYHVADRVATITLNRPDKLNAWTAVMEREVRAAIGEAEHDENVRVIVLTGAGRGFCAGADMSLLSTVAERGLDERDLDDRVLDNPGREEVLG